MYKKLYLFSFASFFVLFFVSIFTKLVLRVEAKFIIIDVVVLAIISVVFGIFSLIVYKRRNKIKKINEKVIPYLLTNFVLLAIAIRIMPTFGNENKIIFGYFDNAFDYRLSILYIVILFIIIVQFIIAFIIVRSRQQAVKTIVLPQHYNIIAILSLCDIFAVITSFVVKTIIGLSYNIVDVICLGFLIIWYLYYFGIYLILNKFKVPKNIFRYLSIVVPIVTALFGIGLSLFPVNFLTVKLQYIILTLINIVVLIVFYLNIKRTKNTVDIFGNN